MATMSNLHQDAIVLDCHNDLIMPCLHLDTLGERATFKHRWIPELRAGGVNVQVVPIFAESIHPESALREALQYIAAFYREVEANPYDVAHCLDGLEIRGALDSGRIAMVLALEGASCLGNEPSLVRVFHRLGVRMISFTHMGRSWLADGSGENDTGGRLTRTGRAALAEMERLGILMDVSHLGLAGTEQVLQLATRPLIASHSSARAICDHHRNLYDEQMRAIAATGGVIGVNLVAGFIDPDNPTVDRAVDHIEHMVGVAGWDHIGLGPDFIVEIFDDFYPKDMNLVIEGLDARAAIPDLYGARHLPNLTEVMVRRGFTEEQVRGILGLNFLRVFDEVIGVPHDHADSGRIV